MAATPTYARRATPGKLTEIDVESERIMEVVLPDGEALSQGMIIYPYRGRWILPLGQLSDSLGLGIQVWSTMMGAEGFVIDESRRFRLDVVECEVQFERRADNFECEEVVPHNDDIYVSDTLLQRWLPVDVNVDSLRSQVIIKPRELIPLEARRKRESEAARIRQGADYDPGYPRVPVPYGAFQLTSFDQQLQAAASLPFSGGSLFNGTTQIAGELLGLESFLSANYDERRLSALRFSLSRRSPTETFYGPLKLRQLTLFDVDVPTMPLIAPVQPARGFMLSSYPIDTPYNYEKTDLQGPLATGWEVLLFRNEVLLDRKVGDASGWYRFSDVQLQYGRNQFKLVFFGPHGERREQYRTFIIDPSHQRPGQTDYRLSVGSMGGGQQLMTLQVSESLGRNLTGLGGVYLERDGRNQYLSLGVVGLTDWFLYTVRTAVSAAGGVGAEVGAQSAIGEVAVGAKYTRLFDFHSRLFNLDAGADQQIDQLEANAYYTLPVGPGFGLNGELLRRSFASGTKDTILRTRLATNIGLVQVQHQLDVNPGTAVPILGRLELFYFPYALRGRFAFEYTSQSASAVEAEVQYVQPNSFQLTGNVRQALDGLAPRYSLQASRLWPTFSLGAFANFQSSVASFGLLAAFSVVREPREGGLLATRIPQAQAGSVSVLAFLDENRNGVRDGAEPGLPGLAFRICNAEPEKTAATGILFAGGVRAQAPCDVSVAEGTNPNPFLRPVSPGYRVVPRPGATARIDYPFALVGQVDGYVTLRDGNEERPRRGIELELVNVTGSGNGAVEARTKSDVEGFFAFEDVPAGRSYRVQVVPEQLARWNYRATPDSQPVTLPPEGAFASGFNFLLKAAAGRQTDARKPLKTKKNTKN